MSQYIIYFNQQWVGDHTAEWFASRGPLANAVVSDMKDAGVLVFAAGVDEDVDSAVTADATSGTVVTSSGLYAPDEQYIGGLTIIDVADDQAANEWGGRIAEACGWPQQIRRVY
ncbi:YciI family protein [Luteimicrobium sp. NPDC057192]|uniref:YciI family protein n=1 Tax=Luteimicrobium sp. NPDC057192 TaxID=3346042 RepID=UPI00363CC99C